MIRRLTTWLDAQGDLLSIGNRLVSFGPILIAVTVLTFAWVELSQGPLFVLVATAVLASACIYYVAFFRAFVAQRERRYQRDVKSLLSSEYKNG